MSDVQLTFSTVTEQLAAHFADALPDAKVDGGMHGLTPEVGHPILLVAFQGWDVGLTAANTRSVDFVLIGAVPETEGTVAEAALETYAGEVAAVVEALAWVNQGKATRVTYTVDPTGSAGFPGFNIPLTVEVKP